MTNGGLGASGLEKQERGSPWQGVEEPTAQKNRDVAPRLKSEARPTAAPPINTRSKGNT